MPVSGNRRIRAGLASTKSLSLICVAKTHHVAKTHGTFSLEAIVRRGRTGPPLLSIELHRLVNDPRIAPTAARSMARMLGHPGGERLRESLYPANRP